MTAPEARLESPSPLLGLSDRTVRLLHVIAFAWALLALVGLVAASQLGIVHHRPGGDAYEVRQQQLIGIVYVVAIVASRKWEVAGGTLAAMAAAAISVFARYQLQPLDATIVVIAFAVPGALWILIYLHDLRPRLALASIALIIPAVLAGGLLAQNIYDGIYGASHPSSTLVGLPSSEVEWVWSGGVTESGGVVSAKVDRADRGVRLAVSADRDLSDPMWFDPVWVDGRIARFEPDGLRASTGYHYAVEVGGVLDTVRAGEFETFPAGPESFTIAIGSCARVGSDGAVFDAIRELDPLLFVITGDFHYSNIGDDDIEAFRAVLDHTLTRTPQAALYRSTPIAYVWDDHDYGANNADSTSPSRPAAMRAYREYVPHYPLLGRESPIAQAFTVGRVRVIMTDMRSARSPAADADDDAKTMLGAEQRAWFERELLAADDEYPLILWVNSVPWIADPAAGGDDWSGYTTERAALADFVAANDIDGLVMVSGDAHMVAFDDGSNSDFSTGGGAGFPVLHAAALDRPGHVKGGPYSHGAFPGGGQFGVVEVIDDGADTVTVVLSGRTWDGDELLSYELTLPAT